MGIDLDPGSGKGVDSGKGVSMAVRLRARGLKHGTETETDSGQSALDISCWKTHALTYATTSLVLHHLRLLY